MDIRLLSELLFLRARLRTRDRWSTRQIEIHQARALRNLRQAAYARSEFYRQHHAGMFDAPLSELPPVTKTDLMTHFDQAVTAPGVRLTDVEEHLRNLVINGEDPSRPWRGRWWTAATAGTTGRRGVFLWNRHEWATILASYARANDWAGTPLGLTHPVRVAVVSSRTPTHQSALVGAALNSRVVPTLRLDATSSVAEIVAELNAFQPGLLVGYPSALKPLAAEQDAGRLRISPRSVMSASEVLSEHTAAELRLAWGVQPFDVYAATETAGIASPCPFHNSHIFEDLVMIEPVDHSGLPVAAGAIGAKVLVTVLFSRTLPLIRYEMSDSVGVGNRGCPCGRSFIRLTGVEGRVEDVLVLPGRSGQVSVHPNVFHNLLDEATISGWQVVQQPASLRVLLAGLAPGVSADRVRAEVVAALESAAVVGTGVDIRVVDAVERTALGKAPLVRRWTGNA
jgi:phenylacetate-CoA ligase